jgi:hypothetical protein
MRFLTVNHASSFTTVPSNNEIQNKTRREGERQQRDNKPQTQTPIKSEALAEKVRRFDHVSNVKNYRAISILNASRSRYQTMWMYGTIDVLVIRSHGCNTTIAADANIHIRSNGCNKTIVPAVDIHLRINACNTAIAVDVGTTS